MTINRTTLLDLPLPVTGTESGTWGDVTNNGLTQYIDIAIAGRNALTSANFVAGDLTISTTEGDSSATNIAATSAQYATLYVSSLAANSTITAPSSNRAYRVVNADATYTLTVKASGQTGVTFPIGTSGTVVFNGTDYVLLGTFATVFNVDNLRLDGNTLSSTDTNGNIILAPNGTGRVEVSGTSSNAGGINFYEDTDNGTNYVAFKAAASIPANVTWTLPAADGTNGQVLSTDGSGILSFATASGSGDPGFKNRIINGAMVIDQRNAGASVATNEALPVDRWKQNMSGGGVLTSNQSTTTPTGFVNSTLVTVSTADASIAAADFYNFNQRIEGFNVADLGFGTANAQSVTLSFWVRSSATNTFAGCLSNSAANRSYTFTYDISVADTWEYKTVTIPGDTSGTWLSNNGIGIRVVFDLGGGSDSQGTAGTWQSGFKSATASSVKLISTLNATFYITGVQLEKGSTATSFDYRPYGTELMLCQRYFEMWQGAGYTSVGFGGAATTNGVDAGFVFKVTKRVAPTLTYSAVGDFIITSGNFGTPQTCTTLSILTATFDSTYLQGRCAGTPFTVGNNGVISSNNTSNAKLFFNSEL